MTWRSLAPFTGSSVRNGDPFLSMQRELSRLFDDAFSVLPAANVVTSYGAGMRMDVKETDKAILVEAEMPGVKEQEVDVTFNDGILTIKGEKKIERDEKNETYHLIERSHGSFSRAIAVPAEIDTDKIEAKFEKGVLTVTLPKQARVAEKSRKISIKSS